MSFILVRERGYTKLVGGWLLALLALTAIVAVLEKGPPSTRIALGPSPLNMGNLGLYDAYKALRERYNTILVLNWTKVKTQLGRCYTAVLIFVSPEVGFSGHELEEIQRLARICRHLGVLIADETTTSNDILSALGFDSRVAGRILRDPEKGIPYIEAVLTLPNSTETYTLWLDIASEVQPGADAEVIGVAAGHPVAVVEEREGAKALVIGDGSLFLNQVVRSVLGEDAKEFLLSAVEYLCAGGSACTVLIDSSKYVTVDPLDEKLPSTVKRAIELEMANNTYVQSVVLARILHPSTWLPPLLSAASAIISSISSALPTLSLVLIASPLALWLAFRRIEPRYEADKPLDALIYGRIPWPGLDRAPHRRLTRDDIISIYETTSAIFRMKLGMELSDPGLPDRLAELGVNRELAQRLTSRLNKAYRSAVRGAKPLASSWDKMARSVAKDALWLLKAAGMIPHGSDRSP
ncbi:MAG: hypothetical protein ABWW70_05720 [Thermoproteota archaeon]